MGSEILIKAESVSKKYCRGLKRSLWYGLHDMGRELTGRSHGGESLRRDEFWAVKDVNFEVRRGECLGLIGHNGAGKSSLLKMVNGLLKPDGGCISIRGRVCGLIELGGGFNPLLSGRENIYINGSVLGISKKEIEKKISAIIEFSELEEFIDMPVMNYSSGMKVRLGFSIMAQIEPDVLIIDEVLAVGDAGFVLKCLNWIDSLLKNTAIIFVSHSMPMVSRICTNIMLLEHGCVSYKSEDVGEGVSKYLSKFSSGNSEVTYVKGKNIRLVTAEVLYCNQVDGIYSIDRLDDMVFRFVFDVGREVGTPVVSLYFLDKEQRPIAVCFSSKLNERAYSKEIDDRKKYEVYLKLKKIQFSPGFYNVTFGLAEDEQSKGLLRVRNAINFSVLGERHVWQPFDLDGEWSETKSKNG